MSYHICALIIGFVVEIIIGKPKFLPQLKDVIEIIIDFLNKVFIGDNIEYIVKDEDEEKKKGLLTLVITILSVYAVISLFLVITYWIHPVMGVIFETAAVYYLLSARAVFNKAKETIDQTAEFEQTETIISEVSEMASFVNFGYITPLFWLALGGSPLGYAYLAVRSYNEKMKKDVALHRDYGWAADRLDHIMAYIPSRLAALYVCFVTKIMSGKFSYSDTVSVYKADANKGDDSNESQVPAAFAGALDMRLEIVENDEITTRVGNSDRELSKNDFEKAEFLYFAVIGVGLIATIILNIIFGISF